MKMIKVDKSLQELMKTLNAIAFYNKNGYKVKPNAQGIAWRAKEKYFIAGFSWMILKVKIFNDSMINELGNEDTFFKYVGDELIEIKLASEEPFPTMENFIPKKFSTDKKYTCEDFELPDNERLKKYGSATLQMMLGCVYDISASPYCMEVLKNIAGVFNKIRFATDEQTRWTEPFTLASNDESIICTSHVVAINEFRKPNALRFLILDGSEKDKIKVTSNVMGKTVAERYLDQLPYAMGKFLAEMDAKYKLDYDIDFESFDDGFMDTAEELEKSKKEKKKK